MSVLHVNQIAARVRALYSEHVPVTGINPLDPAAEKQLLSRCLAAYAVQYKTACVETEAGLAVVDGSNDNGIDAIYVNQGANILVLVQSKWMADGVGEPASADISKFCKGVEDLLNFEWDRFNAAIQAKKAEIEAVINAFDARVELLLIYTGSSSLAVHGRSLVDDLLSKLNDSSELVSFTVLNQGAIYSSLAAGASGDPVSLEFGLANWGRVEDPLSAYYGTITGSELAAWWSANGDRLFDHNLRSVLGKTDVNQEISNTALNRSRDFWYFNNGVTVVANRVVKTLVGGSSRDFGSFRAESASVVNGAQTVSTLGRVQSAGGNIDDVRLLLRVISLEQVPEGATYSADITRTNNTQNRIEARDFATQDPEQTRLKRELALDDITYAIVRSEDTKSADNFIGLPEATVSLACAKAEPGLAVLAKRNIGQFWADITKSPYKTIFNPATTAARLYRSVLIVRSIEHKLRDLISILPRKSGKKYGVLVHGNRLLSALVFKKIGGAALEAEKFSIDTLNIDLLVDDVFVQLMQVVEDLYGDNFMATLFKNTEKCSNIFNRVN